MRAAIYARVSTSDGRQSVDNQLLELRRFAATAGYEVSREYVDLASGGRSGAERSALADLMQDAHERKFDRVLVWALDRFTREGVYKAFAYIQDLKTAGVTFHSFTEPHFCTSGYAGDLFLAIAAWMAQQERSQLQLRVKAGMDRAKAAGKKMGRPFAVVDRTRINEMFSAGVPIRKIADQLNVSKSTVQRALAVDPMKAAMFPKA